MSNVINSESPVFISPQPMNVSQHQHNSEAIVTCLQNYISLPSNFQISNKLQERTTTTRAITYQNSQFLPSTQKPSLYIFCTDLLRSVSQKTPNENELALGVFLLELLEENPSEIPQKNHEEYYQCFAKFLDQCADISASDTNNSNIQNYYHLIAHLAYIIKFNPTDETPQNIRNDLFDPTKKAHTQTTLNNLFSFHCSKIRVLGCLLDNGAEYQNTEKAFLPVLLSTPKRVDCIDSVISLLSEEQRNQTFAIHLKNGSTYPVTALEIAVAKPDLDLVQSLLRKGGAVIKNRTLAISDISLAMPNSKNPLSIYNPTHAIEIEKFTDWLSKTFKNYTAPHKFWISFSPLSEQERSELHALVYLWAYHKGYDNLAKAMYPEISIENLSPVIKEKLLEVTKAKTFTLRPIILFVLCGVILALITMSFFLQKKTCRTCQS